MDSVYNLFQTNHWIQWSSAQFLGSASSLEEAIELLKKYINKEGMRPLKESEIESLESGDPVYNYALGYNSTGFVIVESTLNELH